jgi:hypothetical protein
VSLLFGEGGFGLDAARFTVLAVLVRVVFGHRLIGDHFGLPVPIDWRRVSAAAVGVAGAVACGWLVYGPRLLPFGASLVVAFVAGGVCERLAERWCDRAEPVAAPDRPRD